MSDKPENTETPAKTEKAVKPGAKPAGSKPGTKPAGSKPAGSKPAGTKPTGSKPAGTKPAGTKPAGTKPTGTKPAATAAATETPESQEPVQFVIQKFCPVYLASWEGDSETCSICKASFISPCADCEVRGISDACPAVQGRCGHQYHLHCIEKWVSKNPTCPLCGDRWDTS